MNMSDKSTATVRTGWNIGLFTAVAAIVYKITGWTITVEDLLPFSPVIAVMGGIFYRLSRLISDKAPWLAYVLFGSPKTPISYE